MKFLNEIDLITAGIFLLVVFSILTPFESVQPSPSYLSQVDSTGVIADSSDIEEEIEEDLDDVEEDSAQVNIPSTVSISDSTLVDTTTYVLIDSSARVEHFVYQRKDIPYANPFVKKLHPLFLENRSTAYQINVKLDSTGKYVTLSETIYDNDVKIPVVLPIDEYIKQRLEFERYKNWDALSKVYTEKEKEVGLGELFGSITNIDIPVPAVPLLSIFGPPKINLKISGAVDIRAGFRSQESDQATISYQDKVRNEPNFNQEVQINVNGTIGDKLNILADWNTQRTFEYENQLKLKYTGYEDEVIQSIEAGNVSLQSPASFMGSSAALFGIKGRFQLGPLSLQTVVSQKKGQTRELAASGGAQERPIMIRALDYSTNHFFLDTLYRSIFETIYATISAQLPMSMIQYEVVEIEVRKTRQGS
ncbi:MAG: cell surface protein SprA, partial [Bacteroidetes bacterium]|nr:cell surface protein SprA [Bacteroidota bacterium]